MFFESDSGRIDLRRFFYYNSLSTILQEDGWSYEHLVALYLFVLIFLLGLGYFD